MVKNLPAMQDTPVQSLGQEDPLEKGMATHSSILTRRTPWTKEPGRLQPQGCKESDKTEATYHYHVSKEILTEAEMTKSLFFFSCS